MMKFPAVLGFTALTVLSWGTYGVLLHHGQKDMGAALLKPFVFVGVAYFFIAVLFPGFVLSKSNEKGQWSFVGSLLSFMAGAVGALGALGIILALNFGGSPFYVMPFVFGIAPVVNTLVTATFNRTFNQIKVPFMIGLILVVLGATGVLISKGLTKPHTDSQSTSFVAPLAEKTKYVAFQTPSDEAVDVQLVEEAKTDQASKESKPRSNWLGIILSMIMAAFCWGSYGPVLHIGQMKMGGSRLRPFICVGLAYFFIAVALPLVLIQTGIDQGSWSISGAAWSIGAGALGAMGALGIIYAFNFGGKPIFVMPLVFGFAPIVNTIVSMSEAGTLSQINSLFVGALATTIAGAVMVLVFQPSSKSHVKPQESKEPSTTEPKSISATESKPSTPADSNTSVAPSESVAAESESKPAESPNSEDPKPTVITNETQKSTPSNSVDTFSEDTKNTNR